MTINEAREYVRRFRDISNPSEDEEFFYVECLNYIIFTSDVSEANEMLKTIMIGDAAFKLAQYYEKIEKYDLALKYYKIAAEYEEEFAYEKLGRIYYLGLAGETDYELAYENFEKAIDNIGLISNGELYVAVCKFLNKPIRDKGKPLFYDSKNGE